MGGETHIFSPAYNEEEFNDILLKTITNSTLEGLIEKGLINYFYDDNGEEMFLRITIFLIGIICTVYALTNIILYLNLFVMGYTFIKYVNFIIRSGYFILLLVGLLILYLSIFKGGRK